MELSKEDFIKLVSYAHMAGQSDAGIDASWGNARSYAEDRWNKLNPDLTDKDVALKIAMGHIGATEVKEIKNNDPEYYSVYVTNVTPGPGEVNTPLIILKNESFLIGRIFSNWKEGKPFESKYEYEEVFFKDIMKGV